MVESKFDKEYAIRLFAITFVFYLTIFLTGIYDLNFSLLAANLISLIITPIIWKHDGILKFDIKAKYVTYYIALLILSLILFPKDLSSVFNILYRNGIREEILQRFFMVGIFLKYVYSEEKKSQKKFLYAIFYSNILFMLSHPYTITGLFYILVIGIIFSFIYVQGGLPSAILAHTIHNVYRSKEHTILILLMLVPLVSILPITIGLRNKLRGIFSGIKSNK